MDTRYQIPIMTGERSSERKSEAPVITSSIDRSGAYDQFVIADISCDDQWIGIRQAEALVLRTWR